MLRNWNAGVRVFAKVYAFRSASADGPLRP